MDENEEHYENLNLTELKLIIREWAEGRPSARVILYRGRESKTPYILVATLPPLPKAKMERRQAYRKNNPSDDMQYPVYLEFSKEEKPIIEAYNSTFESCLHLPSDRLYAAYRDVPPSDYYSQWMWVNIDSGTSIEEDFEPDFVHLDTRYVLYAVEKEEGEKAETAEQVSANGKTFQNAFINQGDVWEIWFHDQKLKPIKSLDGVCYIANLLKKPHQFIHITVLRNAVRPQNEALAMMKEEDLKDNLKTGNMNTSAMKDDGLDSTGKKELKERIIDLRKTIKDSDLPVSERKKAEEEYQQLIKTLNTQYGKNPLCENSPKKLNESVKDDLDSVYKAIKRAIDKIRKQSPELADYLVKSIKTGSLYSFDTDGTPWDIFL